MGSLPHLQRAQKSFLRSSGRMQSFLAKESLSQEMVVFLQWKDLLPSPCSLPHFLEESTPRTPTCPFNFALDRIRQLNLRPLRRGGSDFPLEETLVHIRSQVEHVL